MIRECFRAGTNILFITDELTKYGLDADTLYPEVLDRSARTKYKGQARIIDLLKKEDSIDEEDAKSQMNEKLTKSSKWSLSLLELRKSSLSFRASIYSHNIYSQNNNEPRTIDSKSKKIKYKPQLAGFDEENVDWVDKPIDTDDGIVHASP
ncbi:hypothetical protein EW145_g3193 [Phellinidium pouzarii]|uniref:Uncharacterized protein n=1 Tax=Phellinidium pouzarii TaxID=167371 RepID=A0A4S4L7Y5_9AGAM|nr:hypothetical protein EW145_g3193 [Phellinidium pouzarii]